MTSATKREPGAGTAAPEVPPGIRAMQAWVEIGTELWGFLADRLLTDVETQRALMRCTNPIDAQVALLRHGHRALEDYHREAGRLVQMLHRVPGSAEVLDA